VSAWSRNSRYDKYPVVRVTDSSESCRVGWQTIGAELAAAVRPGRFVLCVECYPGALEGEIQQELTRALGPSLVVLAKDSYLREQDLLHALGRAGRGLRTGLGNCASPVWIGR
jgi:hypothetical protein